MPKAWLMLASALNLQLGWGAKWKSGVAEIDCIFWVVAFSVEHLDHSLHFGEDDLIISVDYCFDFVSLPDHQPTGWH